MSPFDAAGGLFERVKKNPHRLFADIYSTWDPDVVSWQKVMLMSELEVHLLLFGEVCLHLLLLLSTAGEVSLDSATSWIHSTVSKHSVLSQADGPGWETSLLMSPRRPLRKGLPGPTLCRNLRKRNTPNVWKFSGFIYHWEAFKAIKSPTFCCQIWFLLNASVQKYLKELAPPTKYFSIRTLSLRCKQKKSCCFLSAMTIVDTRWAFALVDWICLCLFVCAWRLEIQ